MTQLDSLTPKQKANLKKRYDMHCKYEEAVRLYAETDMTMDAIAKKCGFTVCALGAYLRRHWRELVLRRHNIPAPEGQDLHAIKIFEGGKQNVNAHAKYKDVIEACDLMKYIDLNMSQLARKFGVNVTALTNFMRIHYPDTLEWREKVRRRLGINDNLPRGARRACVAQYAEAVELYRTTELTIPEVAERYQVSASGLSQHLRFYHKEILKERKQKLKQAQRESKKKRGGLLGNGQRHQPAQKTEEKYAEALALYRDTALTAKEIVARTGVPAEGFRFYLHTWHKELVLERSGIKVEESEGIDLRKARRRMKTVAAKYEQAIESLRENPRPVSQVAAEFGFGPEVFRDYLHKYEPQLAEQQGMTVNENGKLVSRRSKEKYAEAVRLYATTQEPLKSIAKRLGLVYNSLGGYIRRNHPDLIAKRQRKD